MLLTSVYISVLLHVRLLMKPLPTEGARVRTCVAVYQEVCRQGGRALEGLVALWAVETGVDQISYEYDDGMVYGSAL